MLTEKPLYFSTLPEQHYDPVKNPSIQRNEPILGGNDTDSAQKLSPFLLHSFLEFKKKCQKNGQNYSRVLLPRQIVNVNITSNVLQIDLGNENIKINTGVSIFQK